MKSHFFAYMSRMRQIRRWGLMRNTQTENIAEHSLQVAMVAHALALMHNQKGEDPVDAREVMALALYHEASEVITGDLPTPIKYYNPEISEAYHRIEFLACERLLEMLPESVREDYRPYLIQDNEGEAHRLVKAADRICAYLKCVEEERSGNKEFSKAAQVILNSIRQSGVPEAEAFLKVYGDSFAMTLDELNSSALSEEDGQSK